MLAHKHTRFLPLLLGLMAFMVSACSIFGNDANQTKSPIKAPPAQQTYTIPEVGITDFETLDPALASDPASIKAIQMLYTGLVQVDNKLQIQPQLAQSWQRAKDGVTWTFRLKPNLKFSDGSPLTSQDVAYSLDRALQPTTKSTVAPLYLNLIKNSDQLLAGRITTLIGTSIKTPSKDTIILETSKPAAYFLAALTHTSTYVVQKSLIDKYQTTFTDHLQEGGGAGPFKVATYTHRVGIELVPNPQYYNRKPQLQKVQISFYRSTEQTYLAYTQNKLDSTNIPTEQFSAARKQADFRQVPQLWINYYTMNYLTKPFNNINIRKAFALAIDKKALAKTVWNDTVQPTNHIIPAGLKGYNPQLTGPDGTQGVSGNPQKAQEYLRKGLLEEKWSSVSEMPPIKLTYVSGVNTFDREVTSLITMWRQVLNVQVTAEPVDYDTLLDQVTAATGNNNGLQMWGLAWVGQYPDPQDWLSLQFGKGSPNNNMNYGSNASPTAAKQQLTQQILEQSDTLPTEKTRITNYQQAEQQIINDVAWIPTAQVNATFLRTPKIIGITDNALNTIPPDDWANIYRIQ